MDWDEIESLRRHDAAWRLLRAEHAPLLISFLGRVFVDDNVRSIPVSTLVSRLDDTLYALNERLGEGTYPRPPRAYLDDWASPEAGWLRKYYPPGSDEPHFDATPAVEKALAFVGSLQARSFVGTESRLNTVFDLLRQIVHGSESDPQARLADLTRRRDELDAEIERVRAGQVSVLDAAAQRDRYQQLASTARELLADFREVEDNFRVLDRGLREQIAAWQGSKGDLLDEVVGARRGIAESDQGKSFQAFYDFLLSPARQDEFRDLLARTHALEAIEQPDPRMARIHHDWLDAGERTQATVRLLSEQLRRFLDDQVWLENRRVMELLRSIESSALRLRDHDVLLTTEVAAIGVPAVLPMERPLYARAPRAEIDSTSVLDADEDLDMSRLFEQVYVDRARLRSVVRQALLRRPQVGLVELLREHPLERGLAELVAYLSLADSAFETVFDEDRDDHVVWHDDEGEQRAATLAHLTFVRASEPAVRA